MAMKPSASAGYGVPGGGGDFGCEGVHVADDDVAIERLVARRAEDRREVRGLDAAEIDVAVCDGERPAAPVAHRAGVRARRFRADAQPRAVEPADRSAARRDGVDGEHRRADACARDDGFVRALEAAGVERDIRGGAAHVEADDAGYACGPGRFRHAHDAARRAGEDGVRAGECAFARKPAARLHEHQACRGIELAGHLPDVAAQRGGEVGIGHGGIAAPDELDERGDVVADGNLRETSGFSKLP